MTVGIGGQPGTLTIGFVLMISGLLLPRQSVHFTSADPPKAAQVPTETIAAAPRPPL